MLTNILSKRLILSQSIHKLNIITSSSSLKSAISNSIIKHNSYLFSSSKYKNYKVVSDPKDVSKLIFNEQGKCKIFQHKNGEYQLKWIVRVVSSLTVMNSVLTGLQFSFPIFGTWNQFSFSIFAGIGYLAIMALNALSKRTIHRIYLRKDLQTVDVEFFNAFWKPQTINFHISEFQQPNTSYFGFIRTQLTSVGKAWIKLERNQYRNVKDYQETLDSILLGKPLTNLNVNKKK